MFSCYLLLIILNRNKSTLTKVVPKTITTAGENTLGCTRTTRLDNLPQYDRALSLIQQRIDENHDGRYKFNKMHIFNFFPSQLVNCIKIVEKTPNDPDGYEGYFTLNGSDIKDDYYPIVVNSKYLKSDDILIALLLTHEMTHVQQYIDSINNKSNLSCVEKEVDAFLSSHRFFISTLNDQEMLLVWDRIDRAVDNGGTSLDRPFDGQLLMLNSIVELRRSTSCEMRFEPLTDKYYGCVDSEVPVKLKQVIEEDSYYKKQCKL